VNHSNQWIFAVLLHCQGLEDASHGSAYRFRSRNVADMVKRRSRLRQKILHLLANAFRVLNAGFESSRLQRRRST
jgi:hypothetical protein